MSHATPRISADLLSSVGTPADTTPTVRWTELLAYLPQLRDILCGLAEPTSIDPEELKRVILSSGIMVPEDQGKWVAAQGGLVEATMQIREANLYYIRRLLTEHILCNSIRPGHLAEGISNGMLAVILDRVQSLRDTLVTVCDLIVGAKSR